MRPTEGKTTIGATISTERIVSPSELARHLLVGRPAPRHQDDVEARQSADGEEDEGYDAHDDHGDDGSDLIETTIIIMMMNIIYVDVPLLNCLYDEEHG